MSRPSLRVIAGELASTIVQDTVAVAEAALDLMLPDEPDPTKPVGTGNRKTKTSRSFRVAVIGGGITGLAAALSLAQDKRRGIAVTLFESTSDLGGKLKLHEVGGQQLDAGVESIVASDSEVFEFIRTVGLQRDLVDPETTQTSIWRRGKLRPMPRGLVAGVPGDLQSLAASELLSISGLVRLPMDRVLAQTVIEDDVSIGEYVGTRLGSELVDALVDPLVASVHGSWPADLSFEMAAPELFRLARHERSLLQATQDLGRSSEEIKTSPIGPPYVGIRGGVARLATATQEKLVAKGVDIRTDSVVTALRQTETGWRLLVQKGAKVDRQNFDAVIVALPAPNAARLLRKQNTPASSILDGINYASVGLITLVFDKSQIPRSLSGSGFLVPAEAGMGIREATFLSNKWSWIDSKDDFVVRVSMGRFGQGDLLQQDDHDLINLAGDELNQLTGLPTEVKAANITRWTNALPQYAVGHRNRIKKVRELLSDTPGVAVCGAAYDGMDIGSCIVSGQAAAVETMSYLKGSREA